MRDSYTPTAADRTTAILETGQSYAAATIGSRGRPIPLGRCLRDEIRSRLDTEDLTVSELCQMFRGTWPPSQVRQAIDDLETAGEVEVFPSRGADRAEFVVCRPLELTP